MDNVRCVHIVTARKHLEHEVLQMIVSQVLSGVDNAVHIGFHQLSDNVDVLVIRLLWWLGHIKHFDDVFVVKELKQANLSHDTFCINEILERLGHLLDGNFLVGDVIVGTADDTIGTVADLLNVLKLLIDAESRASTNEFFLSGFDRSQWSFNITSYLLLESLHLFLEGCIVSTTRCLLLTRRLLLLSGVLCLLLLLAFAGGSVLISRCLASAFSWLLLGSLRLLLLLLLHILAIGAFFTSSALSRAMLGRASGLISMIGALLSMGLSLLSALLLPLNLLLGGQVLRILGVLPSVFLSALHLCVCV